MADRGAVPLYILSKQDALKRVAGKRKITVGELLDKGLPKDGEYYLYVRINSRNSLENDHSGTSDKTHIRCTFEELNVDDDDATGRRGALDFYGHYLIQIVNCLTLPGAFFISNFQMVLPDDRSKKKRLDRAFNDVEIFLDEDRCTNGAIYQVEKAISRRFQLDSTYTELQNVTEDKKVNVYGVVKTLAPSGFDGLKLSLTDPSLDIARYMTCYINADSAAQLPVAEVGDVIRFHRISARVQHGGVMQLYGRVGKAGLSWLLFEGTPGSTLNPKSSSASFTLKDSDRETARLLRSWFAAKKNSPSPRIDSTPVIDKSSVTLLKDFGLKNYGNLALQVIGVFENHRSAKAVIIRAWDGTKCLRSSVKVDPDRENLIIYSYNKAMAAAVGDYAVDFFVYDQYCNDAKKFKAGQFIFATNVHFFFTAPSTFTFVVHGGPIGQQYGRSLTLLAEEDQKLDEMKKRIEDFVSKLPPEKQSAFEGNDAATAKEPSGEQNRTLVSPKPRGTKMTETAAAPSGSGNSHRGNAEIDPGSPPRQTRLQAANVSVDINKTPPASGITQRRSASSPVRRPFIEELRRPPLSQSSQPRTTGLSHLRLASRDVPGVGAAGTSGGSSATKRKAVEGDEKDEDEDIYSQPPRAKPKARQVDTVSKAVGVGEASSTSGRSTRQCPQQKKNVNQERPTRSSNQNPNYGKYFERDSDSSSSSSSSDSESDTEEPAETKGQKRIRLRIQTMVTPSKGSPKRPQTRSVTKSGKSKKQKNE